MLRRYEISQAAARDGVWRVAVSGDVDLSAHDELLQAILSAVAAGAAKVIVDLGDVTFFDSGAVGVLIAGRNAAKRAECGYRVVDPPSLVRRVLRTTGILDLLTSDPGDHRQTA
ncbi:MAG: STAS domain-containing protein [Micromonosporaceae bacterium]